MSRLVLDASAALHLVLGLHEAGRLAEAANRRHPVYDLLYIVLARRHGARLLTRDTGLASLAAEMGVEIVSAGSAR